MHSGDLTWQERGRGEDLLQPGLAHLHQLLRGHGELQRVSDQLGRLQRLLAHHQRLHVPAVLLPVAPADVLKDDRVEPLGICGDEAGETQRRGGMRSPYAESLPGRQLGGGGAACGCAGHAGGIGGPHGALEACPLLLWNLTGWEGKEVCAQLRPMPRSRGPRPARPPCPRDSPGKNPGVGASPVAQW